MMRRRLLFALVLLLLACGAAWAADQSDEPSGSAKSSTEPPKNGVDAGIYLDAGKALRFYDVGRLNRALGAAGVNPLTGMIDDWTFELAGVWTRSSMVAVAGGFWSQKAGGSPAHATASGWEVQARYGVATLKANLFQLFPQVGIGYASRSLDLSGNLRPLNLDHLRTNGTADLKQQGMLLEAGLRLDVLSAWPPDTLGAFLAVQSLTVGWQGVPIASNWLLGTNRVGLPHDFTNALFVRFALGFGGGVRKLSTEED